MSNGSQLYTFLKEDIFLVVVNCLPDRKLTWEIIKNGVFLFVSLYFSGSGKCLMSTRCLCSVVVVQSPSHVRPFAIPQTAAHQAALSLTISWSLPKFMFIALVMPSSHLILCCPLLLPSTFPSISDFCNKSSVWIRWPKYWSFSFSISPSSEYSGLISLKIDWSDFLAIQRTFMCLLQHHSSKASILWHSAFFTVQFSQPYMTTGKTIALTIRAFVGRVMSLLFNILSRFVIVFLPRSNRLLISWLQSPSAVILESKKRKSVTTSAVSPSICHAVTGLEARILIFINI